MTKGQRAMAVAKIYPEPEKGGRGKKGAACGEFSGVPTQRVSEARAVLQYAPDLPGRSSGRVSEMDEGNIFG